MAALAASPGPPPMIAFKVEPAKLCDLMNNKGIEKKSILYTSITNELLMFSSHLIDN